MLALAACIPEAQLVEGGTFWGGQGREGLEQALWGQPNQEVKQIWGRIAGQCGGSCEHECSIRVMAERSQGQHRWDDMQPPDRCGECAPCTPN
eukprot:7136979-Alexandrium_andersonii.AAC.1